MAEIKKINTELQLLDKFLDTSGDAGTSGQVLTSTGTGINWVSGGSLPGGPYLPLTAGASYPLTGGLFGTTASFSNQVDINGFTNNKGLSFRTGFTPTNVGIMAKAIGTANRDGLAIFGYNGIDFVVNNGANVAMRIVGVTGSGMGNVGIGTTSPDGLLNLKHVTSTSSISEDASDYALTFNFAGTTNDYGRHIAIRDSNGDAVASIGGVDLGGAGTTGLYFATGSVSGISEAMRIDSTGNVGIGMTSPAKKLTVATDFVNNGVYITTLGGTNVARIGTSSTATSGVLALLAGGSTKVFISAKANENSYFNGGGNVGIGTTTPGSKLSIRKDDNTVYDPTSDDGQRAVGATILLNNNSTTTNTFGQIMYDTDSSGQGVARIVFLDAGSASSAITFVTEQSDSIGERMRIDSTGKVGIGTNSPAALLHLSSISPSIYIEDADATNTYNITSISNSGGNLSVDTRNSSGGFVSTDYQIVKNASGANYQRWFTVGTEKMRLTAAGNVGIGTATPLDLLALHNNTAGAVDAQMNFTTAATGQTSADGFRVGWNGSVAQMYLFEDADMRFATNNVEKMRITSAGNVGIGTTGPNFKLAVVGTFGVSDLPFNTGSVSVLVADETIGAELITNGDFATDTAWTKEAGWTITGGELVATNAAGTTACYQGPGLTSGNVYKCTFTISEYTSGQVSFRAGTTAANTFFDAVGTYSVEMTAGGALQARFSLNGTSTLKISECSIKEVTSASNQIQKRELGTGAFGPTPVGAFLPVNNPTFTGVLTGPSADLEFIKLTAANPGILMKETNVTDKNWDIQLNGGNLKFYEVNDARSVFNERVTFTPSGNVGIGDTSPSFKLDVNVTSSRARFKASTGDANIELSSIAGHDWLIQSKSDSSLAIYDEDEASERIRISSAGAIKFNAYGAGTLVSDASGNITSTSTPPGTGTFLPLAGGTMDSGATIGGSGTLELGGTGVTNLLFDSDGTNIMQLVKASASLQYAQIISNDDKVRLRFRNGMDVYYDDTGLIDYMYFHALGSHTTQFKTRNFEIIGIGASNDETFFKAEGGGAVSLYYDNVLQLNTTSTGISTNTIDATVSAGSAGNFVVMDGTRLASRTAAQVLADIGAAPATGGAYLPLSAGSSFPLTGDLYFESSSTDVVMSGNGSGAFTIDNTTGQIAFKASGSTVQSMIITSSQISLNERVSVNTTSMDTVNKLQVNGQTRVVGNFMVGDSSAGNTAEKPIHVKQSGAATIRLEDSDNANLAFDLIVDEGVGFKIAETIGGDTGDDVRFLIEETTGNVGIGTTSPSSKLTVSGPATPSLANGENSIRIERHASAAASPGVIGNGINFAQKWWSGSAALQVTGGIYGIKNAANGTYGGGLAFYTQPSSAADMAQRMVIDTSGNVGIGTTTPTAKLHVVGTGLFTGLVSGITPVAAANFVTKAYVDGSGGGTGPFLPLAGGTMTGTNGITMPDNFPLLLGTSGINDSQIFWDGSNIEIQARKANADIVFRSANNSGNLLEFLAIDGGVEKTRAYKDIHFQDNIKATFGDTTSPDLQIYHDGSDSYINEIGTGSLYLKSAISLVLSNITSGSVWIECINNQVELKNAGSTKLTTTSTGVTVTGDGTFSGFVYAEDEIHLTDAGTTRAKLLLNSSDRDNVELRAESLGSTMKFFTVGTEALELDASQNATFAGDITSKGLTVDYTGNRTGDAGILVTNDGSDWGIKVDKDGTTDYGILSQTDGENAIVVRNAAGTNKIQLQGDGDASFVGKATSAQTAASDSSITLTTKSYVDGLVTGVPVYKGTWAAGTTGVTSAAISSTTITLTAAPAETIAIGDVVTADGITAAITVTAVGSQTSVTVNASVTIASGVTVTFSPTGGYPNLTLAANKVLGNYYIVSTAGTARPNGAGTEPDSWNVGDWCIFSDITPGAGTDLWQKIDNTSVISGAGTGQKVTKWAGAGPSETLTDGPITFSTNDSTFAGIIGVNGSTNANIPITATTSSGYEDVAYFKSSGTNINSRISLFPTGTGSGAINSTANNLLLQTTGVTALTLDASQNATFAGNVGIGGSPATVTHNPHLDIVGNRGTLTVGTGYFEDNGTTNFLNGARPLSFGTGGTERMRINSSGNVGIGNTNPLNKLTVQESNTGTQITTIPVGKFVNTGNSFSKLILGSDNANFDGVVSMDNNSTLANTKLRIYIGNGTSATTGHSNDHIVLQGNGNVGIGTIAPKSKLQVAGGIQMADDTATPSADKVGTMRYRTGTEYVDVDGTEIIVDGNFSVPASWVVETNWSISGGQLVASGATGSQATYQVPGLVTGKIYRVQFEITAYTSGTIKLGMGTSSTGSFFSGVGIHTEIVTAAGTLQARFMNGNGGSPAVSLTIDNASVVEVVAEDASYADMCMQTGASTYEWVNIVRNTY